jgi:TonB-linked SusC/RagA family outer membrane protein
MDSLFISCPVAITRFIFYQKKLAMLKKKFQLPALLCSLLLVLFAQPAISQNPFTVKGTVTDPKGLPVRDVTVKQRGTGTAVVTDVAGAYSINVSSDTSQLVFSHIAMQIVIQKINKNALLNISMKPKEDELTDVVIIGYNSTRRKDLTASVSSVGKEALSDRTLFSVADALKGKAAGVQITQNDGTPGSAFTFRIRGASSVSAGSTPLFVIDGVLQDDADYLNPGDIENIEILKDASGTSMYGARGANGVIIITTKTGKAGRTRLEFYTNQAMQEPGHLFKVMNTQQYARARFLASSYLFTPASASDPDVPASTQAGYTYYRDSPSGTENGGFWGVIEDATYHDWENYASKDSVNTDWQDAMFQNSLTSEYRINMSGGSRDTKFSLSGGYLDQGGLLVFSNFKRYTGRFNLSQKLNNNINMTLNLSGGQSSTDGFISGSLNGGIASNSIVTAMFNKPPTEPLTQSDVQDNIDIDGYVSTNPYSLAKYITNKKSTTDWLARLAFDFNLSREFMYRVTGTYSTTNGNTDAYYPKFTASGSRYNGRAYLSRATTTKFLNEHLLYFKKQIGQDHNINAVAGMIFEKRTVNLTTAENQDYDIELLGVYGLDNGTVPIIPTYNITKWSMASYLARAEYSLKNKYLFTATFRADGSSRFSKSNKWGYFPSAALGWKVSEENFMKNIKAVSNLKLRTSYGLSGNTAIPSYLTLSTIGTYFSPINGNIPNYGVVIERPENLSLKWETTTQANIGLDLGLFNNRINITAEWYNKKTKDLLIQKVTPGYSGYRSTWTNLGSIKNSGMEFNVGAVVIPKKKSFGWNIDANIGFNRSKAIEIGSQLSLDPGVVSGVGTTAIISNGQPIGQWYGYKTDGIYQSYDEILNSGLTEVNGLAIKNVRPGTRRFVDQNGDGIINSLDRVILGQGQPKFTGGLTNSLSYKKLSMNFIIQYSYGNNVYNANRVALEQGRNPTNMAATIADSWRPSLYDMTSGALLEQGNPDNTYRMPGGPGELLMLSDWIEDGSYIRLADLTFAYDFVPKKANKAGWRGLTVFVSGKNLFIVTKYSGYDPEVNTRQGGFGDLMPSLDYASYPRARLYSLGAKLLF